MSDQRPHKTTMPEIKQATATAKIASSLAFDFNSVHTENFPKILKGLNISLAVTSYQSSRLFFIRSDGETLDTHFMAFPRPMGLTADTERITLGTWSKVLEFRRNDAILKQLQSGRWENPGNFANKIRLDRDEKAKEEGIDQRRAEFEAYKKADTLFIPRATHVTGMINIHDIAWGFEGLWVVNSTFSCLCTLDSNHSFIPRWKPQFITELAPEDRCHLNGMAMYEGKPKYVTTFNRHNYRDSWYDNPEYDGTLIDIDTQEVLLSGMVMPHSPRWYKNAIYLCESGRGQVLRFDPKTKTRTVLAELPGYTRGINFFGPLMFVGLSKVRSSNINNPIPIAKELEESQSGVWIYNMETQNEIGHVRFEGDIDQIYDIAIIPDAAWPELIGFEHPRTRHLFDYPKLQA